MKIAGAIVDFYDDLNGSVLKQAYPTKEELPECVKTAHILNREERDILRDDAYALILHDNGHTFRKFACVDTGNTLLACLYFDENAHLLPPEAIKVAASNLSYFCNEFGISPSDFIKMSSEEGIQKVANLVDVSKAKAKTYVTKVSSERTALDNNFPLDSYSDVTKAVDYFNDNWVQMPPSDRREYAVKTAARAEEIGVPVPELLERYGSTSYSLDIEAHLAARKANAKPEFGGMYDMLKEKRSSVSPDTFAVLLGEADKVAGLNWNYGRGSIHDPFFSTFGGQTKKASDDSWSWESKVGDFVNADQLKKLAIEGRSILKESFSDDIVNAFQKNPITIFKSLPDTTKIIFCRIANELN